MGTRSSQDTSTCERPLLAGEVDRPAAPPARSKRVAEAVTAAHRILEEEGVDALTMRRLAEEMGIQAPSLYKHFSGKADLEFLLIEDALYAVGAATHQALHDTSAGSPLLKLLVTYREHSLSHPNLYRLATSGHLDRQRMPTGLEEWAGNPWFVVTGEPLLAQALWSMAHGMVILELDDRYSQDSDLDATWQAGAAAFERAVSVSPVLSGSPEADGKEQKS